MRVDKIAVRRLVEHHLRLGVNGLFLCGSCGEGPWMRNEQRRTMIHSTAEYAGGRLVLAAQVTDNSSARILDNMRLVKEAGADVAVIAPPFCHRNPTARNIADLYIEAIRESPLPVGIYDLLRPDSVNVPNSVLKRIYEERNVILVKDSSVDPARMKIALAARRKRRNLRLLDGYEFDCVTYLKAGYDGLLLGGGIFNGYLARMIMDAVGERNMAEATRLQGRMNRLMWDVYGGKKIACWLSGQKELLVQMGIFRTNKSYLRYPLTSGCRRAIKAALKREADVLFP